MFDGAQHIAMASLPGMRERTSVISSGGKTFNTTGWKIGWLCGPAPLVQAARTAKQFLTYVTGGPFQPAMALGLGLPDAFFAGLAADLQAKRDRLMPGLLEAGFTVFHQRHLLRHRRHPPAAARWRRHGFCRPLPHRCGVVAIPTEVLYANKDAGRHIVRFAFCKQLDVLDEAVGRLRTLG